MKSVRWFSLLVAMLTVALFLTACSESDPASSGPGAASPAPAASTAPAASSPAVATNGKPAYSGSVDKKDCETVGGWVVGKDSTVAVKVEFYIDGKLIDSASATSLRQDLTSWGTGKHGFTFKIPAAYRDGNPHTTKVKVAGTDNEVPFIQNASGIQCPAS